MRRDLSFVLFVVVALCLWFAMSQLQAKSVKHETTVTIKHIHKGDVSMYWLVGNDKTGTVTIAGDRDLPLMKWLALHRDQRVVLTLGKTEK